tara:strand:- start:5862 stop:7109 length:1248 start_codon:yes stop_codon:yes gene_type:complete
MKKKIFVRGPVLSQSGYGEQSRFALRALRSREDLFDIFIQPTNWGQTGWIWKNDEFRQWMDEKITLTQVLIHRKQFSPDISLQVTIPNEFEKMAPINIGYTAGIETTNVSPQWLQVGNEKVDKILVVSNHAKSTYENTVVEATNQQTGETFPYRLQTPIDVVWENTVRHEPESIPGLNLSTEFNFLMVSQMGPRKNFENAIKWWVEEFIDQKVGLVVKTNIKNNSKMDLQATQSTLKSILDKYQDRKCKVFLLHGDLSSGQMTGLYTNPKIKAIINIAHGEGFGLPLYEAAREGLPIITINWSGQQDFLNHEGKNYFQEVDFTLQPIPNEAVWNGVLQQGSKWAYADQGSYKMALRKIRKKWKNAKKTAEELKIIVNNKFSDERLFEGFCDAVYGEKIDVNSWLQELEEEIVEQE